MNLCNLHFPRGWEENVSERSLNLLEIKQKTCVNSRVFEYRSTSVNAIDYSWSCINEFYNIKHPRGK